MLEVRSRLASLYLRTEEPDLAAGQFRRMLEVLERLPEKAERQQQVVRQLAQVLYLRMNQFDQAQRLISEYMERHPDEPVWPFELGQLFEFQAKQDATAAAVSYSSAATYYQRAVDAAGADSAWAPRAMAARLSALVKAKRYRDVIEAFLNLGDIRPTPAIRVSAARAYQRLDQGQAAGEQWQRALIEAGIQSIELAGAAATELRQSVPPDNADDILQRVAAAQPPESPAGLRLRLVLASHRAAAGEPTRALPVLTEVLAKVRPGQPEHLSALLTRALVYDQTGDAAASVATYRDVLRSYPGNVSALNNLSYLLVTSDEPSVYRPQEALTYAERLRTLVAGAPNAGLALDTVGWVYFKNDQLALAAAALEEGLSLNPENLALPLHLGQVYQQQGRLAEARTMLNRGLDMARARGDADYQRQFEEQIENLR